jgi:nicotinate-nucleotide adenylyltransferase
VSRTIAVYGGSFDPPHIAHTLVCSYVLCAYAVDLVLVVPAGRHPFDKQLSAFEHRLKMCEIALRDLKRVELSSIERDLQGPSLTLRTLEHVQNANPDATLRLVIGSDLLPETPSWHRFDRICELAPPLVVPRAGFEVEGTPPALPDLSSTEARSRLRAGLPTEGLLDPQVAAYARSHGLYQARPDALPGR